MKRSPKFRFVIRVDDRFLLAAALSLICFTVVLLLLLKK